MGKMKELAREQQEKAAYYDTAHDESYLLEQISKKSNEKLDKCLKDLELLEKEMTLLMDCVVKLTEQVTKALENGKH